MSDDTKGATRRDFLKIAATGAPAAAVVAVAGGSEAAAAPAPGSAGLRRTAHVEKYLETARF